MTSSDLKRQMSRVKKAVREAVEQGEKEGGTVNVAVRKNIVVAGNNEDDGGTISASSTQVAPIQQNGRASSSDPND